MFPTLSLAEVERLRRFGEPRSYAEGERLVSSGVVSPGMFVILKGEVAVTQHGAFGLEELIVTHRAGSFMGELAQLSDRPALVDARATQPVEAIVISSRRLRDVLLVPLALERSALYSPLALVILGGLVSSTLLARVVTPVLYELLPPEVEPTRAAVVPAATPLAAADAAA